MSPVEEGAYLPREENPFKAWWYNMYLRLAYRPWSRALAKFLRSRPTGEPVRVLDCGCGPGLLLSLFEKWFPAVQFTGIDMDRQSLRYAQQSTSRVRLIRGSVSGAVLPVATGCCEVLLVLHVIEHLEEPDAFLRDARRVLVPGGLLMFATPNPIGLPARWMGERWRGIRADHVSLRPPDSWRAALVAAGFTLRRDGTTTFSGIPLLQRMPLSLLHWIPLLIWEAFPWQQGEAYVCWATAT